MKKTLMVMMIAAGISFSAAAKEEGNKLGLYGAAIAFGQTWLGSYNLTYYNGLSATKRESKAPERIPAATVPHPTTSFIEQEEEYYIDPGHHYGGYIHAIVTLAKQAISDIAYHCNEVNDTDLNLEHPFENMLE